MEERHGTYLSRSILCLAEWSFSLMPYGVLASMLVCWVILGWNDAPLWMVWHPVFLVSVVGRYLAYMMEIAYGWNNYVRYKGRTSWWVVVLDAGATVASTLMVLCGERAISWYWRWYIIGCWICGCLLTVWLLSRFVMDLEAWWRNSGDDNVPCQGFCEYVRAVNAVTSVEQTGDLDNAGGGCLEG